MAICPCGELEDRDSRIVLSRGMSTVNMALRQSRIAWPMRVVLKTEVWPDNAEPGVSVQVRRKKRRPSPNGNALLLTEDQL